MTAPAPTRTAAATVRVDVWLVPLGFEHADDAEYARCWELLDAQERIRADRFRSWRDRRRFVLAHGATREVLAEVVGTTPAELSWGHGPYGKPLAIDGRHEWNLSHSGDLAAVAVAAEGGTGGIGVDVQRIELGFDAERFASRRLSPAERGDAGTADAEPIDVRTARALSRKEACAKAVGGRLLDALAVEVPGAGAVEATRGALRGSCWRLVDLEAPTGWVGALAAVAPGAASPTPDASPPAPPELQVRQRTWNREDPR